MAAVDLLDINVWLALTDENHSHHARARGYWETESAPAMAFCRITMLGFLRLLTHSVVMAGHPFSVPDAWRAYRAFRALPEITFLDDPPEVEAQFALWTESPDFSPKRWTDGYLTALCHVTKHRLVSFDADYRNFSGLDYLHLSCE